MTFHSQRSPLRGVLITLTTPLFGSIVVAFVLIASTLVAAQDRDHATSRALNRALGVECSYCHAPSGSSSERPARATARRMMAMVTTLNERLASLGGRVTCWTCHAGARVPSRIERAAWEQILAEWPKNAAATSEEVKTTMAVYTASVGRTCAGCHEAEGRGPATEEAVTLVRTMNDLFTVMKEYLPSTARPQCFMCHKGRPHPAVRPSD